MNDPRVVGRWRDVAGHEHVAPPETVAALGAVLGAEVPPPMRFVRAGTAMPLAEPSDLQLEDGARFDGVRALPADLPLGYHWLRSEREVTAVVVTPGRCHLPSGLRAWGWAVQLAATRSRSSWGMGDLADLRQLAAWSAERGAGFLALSPLHAPAPSSPQQPSPYYASSRRFRNPLHLRVEEVDGAELAAEAVTRAAAAGRALDEGRRIDRDRVWALKREALEACFRQSSSRILWHDHRYTWGRWCALAEVHSGDWRRWPPELRHPSSPAVGEAVRPLLPRVAFHLWLQQQLDRQVGAVGLPLVQDLAVGFDPGGFDAWEWQDRLALDWRIGAPPDEFNRAGQDWGLPPFVPAKLRAARYEPFVETVRAVLRHAGGLRVDHVMGLFRLFWVPPGGAPSDGTYVRSPASDLLDLLALESVRAGAVVVGEDLGTVEPEFCAELAERRVLSTRLLWFEDDPPARWPEQALAMVTTHDLPTVAGVWTGADLDGQRSAGVLVTEDGNADLRRRLAERAAVSDDASVDEVVVAAHETLAEAPSALVSATLEDALAVTERPNMPGTVDTWPNWSLALPEPLEVLEADPRVRAVADALGEGREGGGLR
ncbi:MAG: 4-alpha-glucanotransferase [Acidimicrobiia bacterium]|nr:4-alpha-glucanotransferase [Acidimicrobiia bacterium]